MAEEQVQELPADGSTPVESSGGNPWIPVIAVVILSPVISFAVAQFVVIPKILAAVNVNTHGAPAAEGEAAEGEGEGAEGAVDEAAMVQYAFDSIVANLSGSMQSRYVKVSFTAEGDDPDFESLMEKNKVKIIDITIGILNSLSMKDLEQPGIKNIVRSDLLNSFHTLMKKKVIHQIYFTDFVVQ